MPNKVKSTGQDSIDEGRVIKNVAMLDLTTLKSPEELADVEMIKNVATILIPESLMGALMRIPQKNIASVIPIPDGDDVEVQVTNGVLRMGGETLANPTAGGGESMRKVLVVNGPLVITSAVTESGYFKIIVNGPVLVPEGNESAVGAAISTLNGPMTSYPTDGNIEFQEGQVRLTPEAIANEKGSENDVLILTGQAIIEGPIEKVGYSKILAVGQAFAPRGLISSYLSVTGQVIYYNGTPRIFNGNDSFSNAFFEYLPEPVSLLLNGRFTFEPDVTVDSVRGKVTEIILNGMIEAEAALVPLLQVLTVEKNGMIEVAGKNAEKDTEQDPENNKDEE